MNADLSEAAENVMLKRLLDKVNAFYADKKNLQAFEAWLKKKKKT